NTRPHRNDAGGKVGRDIFVGNTDNNLRVHSHKALLQICYTSAAAPLKFVSAIEIRRCFFIVTLNIFPLKMRHNHTGLATKNGPILRENL
ncbi:MAG: hypothetical protein RSA78_09730, partial [Oscillospiraceae bacterium]